MTPKPETEHEERACDGALVRAFSFLGKRWNGVILGDDLLWRQDRWLPNPEASRDSALNGTDRATFLRLVRNTYKVLLTRGMSGTLLYSTDPETQERLRQLVPAPTAAEPDPSAPAQQPI